MSTLKEANQELHNEISRLRNRLGGAEKVYKKYQYTKIEYAKLLDDLEKSELQRRQLVEDVKGLKKHMHKLKKDKRDL